MRPRASTAALTRRLCRSLPGRGRPGVGAFVDTTRSTDTYERHPSSKRRYATSRSALSTEAPEEVAVLGGGLTGLTTAYYLSKFLPSTSRITLYEGEDRLGGWVHSRRGAFVMDDNEQKLMTEAGPRVVAPQSQTSKYDDLVLYEVLDELGLEDFEVWSAKRGEPHRLASRHILLQDSMLHMTPPSFSFLRHPLASARSWVGFARSLYSLFISPPKSLEGLRSSLVHYYSLYREDRLRQRVSPEGGPGPSLKEVAMALEDESIGEFWTRRLGRRDMVDELLSALVRGVYGGDVWSLSVQSSMFGRMQLMADQSLKVPADERGRRLELANRSDLALLGDVLALNRERGGAVQWMARRFMDASNFGFVVSSLLPAKIGLKLGETNNVTIRKKDHVKAVMYDPATSRVKVRSDTGTRSYDKVISTLYSKTLASLAGVSQLPALASAEAVSMHVLNMVYSQPGLTRKTGGFGFLISAAYGNNLTSPVPKSASIVARLTPLGALFDSEREACFPEAFSRSQAYDTRPSTKVTFMFRWDAERGPHATADEVGRVATWVAEGVLRSAGVIPEGTEFAMYLPTMAVDCIPQHRVGHRRTMAAAHDQLLRAFGGRLAVAGPSYTAPGVLPSMRAARDVAAQVAGREYPYFPDEASGDTGPFRLADVVGTTGLSRFAGQGEGWAGDFVFRRKESLPFRFGNKGCDL